MLSKYLNSRIQKAYEFMQNDSETAIKIFDDVLEIEPENIEAINGKGSTLMKLNKISAAERYFDKSLSICENSSALINKGIISKSRHDYRNALGYYEKAILNNSDLENIINILKNEVYDILDKKEIVLNNYSKQANEYIKMGEEYKNKNKLWDAISSYELAILKDSSCKSSLSPVIDEIKEILFCEFLFDIPELDDKNKLDRLKIQCLRALETEKDYKKALTLMDIILDINKEDLDILNRKGCTLFLFDKYNNAINCFDECLAIDDEYYYAKFNKGLVLRRMDKLNEALICLNEVLEVVDDSKVKKYQMEILEKLYR